MALGQAEADRLSHGDGKSVSVDADVVISEFRVAVECDSRIYAAIPVSVTRAKGPVIVAQNKLHGC